MRRPSLLLIVTGGVLFLAISLVLARVWSVEGAETSAVTALVQAEARGDQSGMISRLSGCARDAVCLARVAGEAARLRQTGRISILALTPSAGFSLGATLGSARVAWKSQSSLPIVQCVRVRRAGDVIGGLQIELLAISSQLKGDADCSRAF